MTVSLVDHDRMHAELLALKKDTLIKAEKEIMREQLKEMKVNDVTEFSSANPILD